MGSYISRNTHFSSVIQKTRTIAESKEGGRSNGGVSVGSPSLVHLYLNAHSSHYSTPFCYSHVSSFSLPQNLSISHILELSLCSMANGAVFQDWNFHVFCGFLYKD